MKHIFLGGSVGQESIYNGLHGLKEFGYDENDLILIHDAVRPLVSQEIISNNIATCKAYGYAITAIKCSEAILESDDGFSSSTSIPRDKLFRTQTPQTFTLKSIVDAHIKAQKEKIENSVSSCTLLAELGDEIMHLVHGSEKNFKITTVEDLEMMKALLLVEKDNWLK